MQTADTMPWYANREERMSILIEAARQHRTILVRAPVFAGKTVFCQLLEHYFTQKKLQFLFVNYLELTSSENFAEFFKKSSNLDLQEIASASTDEFFIFIDETQEIISQEQKMKTFWNIFNYVCQRANSKLRIILFSSSTNLTITNPFNANYSFGIDFLKCSVKDEQEIFDKFSKYFNIELSPVIRTSIAKSASHHIGFLSAILEKVSTLLTLNETIRSDANLLEKRIFEMLLSQDLLSFLCKTKGSPLFNMNTLTDSQLQILVHILLHGKIIIQPNNSDDISKLLTWGYLWFKHDNKNSLTNCDKEVKFVAKWIKNATMKMIMTSQRGVEMYYRMMSEQ